MSADNRINRNLTKESAELKESSPLTTDEQRKIIREELRKFLEDELARIKVKSQLPSPSTVDKKDDKFGQEARRSLEAEIEKVEVKLLCQSGEMVEKRFQILYAICQGGHTQIYNAYDWRTNQEIALKVEKVNELVTADMERHVLRKFQKERRCPRFFDSGKTPLYTYLAMELLGKNLTELRKSCVLKNPKRFSVSSSVRATYQCLEAIEALHNIGYLHRGIKPSNFVIGKSDQDGRHKSPRTRVGFRGTVRYASINAHRLKDLSRRDDLWSLFYSFHEFMTGRLKWRKTNDRQIVADLTVKLWPKSMCVGLPKEMNKFVDLIAKLEFADKPRYKDMYTCLKKFTTGLNAKFSDSYDWQITDCSSLYHWAPLVES